MQKLEGSEENRVRIGERRIRSDGHWIWRYVGLTITALPEGSEE